MIKLINISVFVSLIPKVFSLHRIFTQRAEGKVNQSDARSQVGRTYAERKSKESDICKFPPVRMRCKTLFL